MCWVDGSSPKLRCAGSFGAAHVSVCMLWCTKVSATCGARMHAAASSAEFKQQMAVRGRVCSGSLARPPCDLLAIFGAEKLESGFNDEKLERRCDRNM